jgi:hypothetical protein
MVTVLSSNCVWLGLGFALSSVVIPTNLCYFSHRLAQGLVARLLDFTLSEKVSLGLIE